MITTDELSFLKISWFWKPKMPMYKKAVSALEVQAHFVGILVPIALSSLAPSLCSYIPSTKLKYRQGLYSKYKWVDSKSWSIVKLCLVIR